MSTDQLPNQNEQQRQHVKKYILGRLENYAHKSNFWRLLHASHLHRNLLRRSRRVSKICSTSEDFVRQCINELFTDVDQYVRQLHRLIYLQQFDDLIPLCSSTNTKNSVWRSMQLKRARHLFPTEQQLGENDILANYYKYIREKLTPKHNVLNANQEAQLHKCSFDLNLAYTQAEHKGKEYLKNTIKNFRQKKIPNLEIIDEMIKLGT
jgi:N-glycosylase/DNA lyase